MTAVPVPRTWAAGEVITASRLNANISDVLTFVSNPPICQAYSTGAQSITTSTFTALTLNSEDVDSSGMHSTVSNTSRLTAVYPGWYQCSAGVSWTGSATGRRGGKWFVNNTTSPNGGQSLFPAHASVIETVFRTMFIFLNAGDFVEAQGWQDSGGSLNTIVANNYDGPNVAAKWESN